MFCYPSRRSSQGRRPGLRSFAGLASGVLRLRYPSERITLMLQHSNIPGCRVFGSGGLGSMMKYIGFLALYTQAEPIEREVENGGGIESQELAYDQAADNANTKWPPQF
jgi:hypothetical protein